MAADMENFSPKGWSLSN